MDSEINFASAPPLLGGKHGLNRGLQFGIGSGDLGMPLAFLDLLNQHGFGLLVVLVLRGDILVCRADFFLVHLVTVETAFGFQYFRSRLGKTSTSCQCARCRDNHKRCPHCCSPSVRIGEYETWCKTVVSD